MKVKITRNARFCLRSASCDRLVDYEAGTILEKVYCSTNDGWSVIKFLNNDTIDGPAEFFELVKEPELNPVVPTYLSSSTTVWASGIDTPCSG